MALTPPRSRIARFNAWLESPEDGACLALFRAAFGLALAVDATRSIYRGWAWAPAEQAFSFEVYGLEWLTALPALGLTALHVGIVVAGLLIAVGGFYRAAMTYAFLAHTYSSSLTATTYDDSVYLLSLITFLLIWTPANRVLAADAWRDPSLAGRPTPKWCRFTLRAQLALVYLFGAVAKLDADWLAGVPLAQRLDRAAEREPWAAELLLAPQTVDVLVWAGLGFDLLIVPALLWRRTRALGFALLIAVEVATAVVLELNAFWWLLLGATTLFFAPDWPRAVPGLRRLFTSWQPVTGPDPRRTQGPWVRLIWVPVCAWLLIQLLVPLRHHLYPGDVAWTEEGHAGSWRMQLRSKRGRVLFRVRDRTTGEVWRVYPERDLSPRQVAKMAGHPALILQYAHHVAELERARVGHEVEVRADAFASLNYRRPQRLIDPRRDLAEVEASLRPADWILPFERTAAERPRPE